MNANTMEQFRMSYVIEVPVIQEGDLSAVHGQLHDTVIDLANDLPGSEYQDP